MHRLLDLGQVTTETWDSGDPLNGPLVPTDHMVGDPGPIMTTPEMALVSLDQMNLAPELRDAPTLLQILAESEPDQNTARARLIVLESQFPLTAIPQTIQHGFQRQIGLCQRSVQAKAAGRHY